ncbi:hypothetical protein AS594_39815 [Streptomyces agglomeratus]|uniref:Uncharacterized protein n=1 Tax=Streptomyces agglomeratus TaxID=285458 RepID=A0A1E5NZB8_9ACTN|nr:hypothetical protein [Streptomyces agglomeratus]OEJ21662.1 hypothetical protein AS594_39815 [Streptomyces agglomeratus]
MTVTSPTEHMTVRALLFGEEGGSATDALAGHLHERDVAETLSHGARGMAGSAGRAVEREVATVVDGFLAMDLIDLLGAGWRKHSALTAAARRTRDTPDSEELVALVSHHITSTHRPCVDLIIDGVNVGTINLAITVDFDLNGVIAIVRDARLAALRSGECTATGTLAIEENTVASRNRRLDLPGMIRLRSGIPLLTAEHLASGGGPTPESIAAVTGFRTWLETHAEENEALGDLARANAETLENLLRAGEHYWDGTR